MRHIIRVGERAAHEVLHRRELGGAGGGVAVGFRRRAVVEVHDEAADRMQDREGHAETLRLVLYVDLIWVMA